MEVISFCKENPVLQRTVLIVVCLTSFLTPFMLSGVNIALPMIQAEFGASAVQLTWVITSFLLAISVFLVPMGKLADMYGRRRFFIYGLLGFVITSIGSGLAVSMPMLIAMRALQGIGGAMLQCTGVAILVSVFPGQQRGRAMGFLLAAVYLGLSLGPFVGGWLTRVLGWRSIFLLNATLCIYALGLTWARLKEEWIEGKDESFDWQGSLVYGTGLTCFMIGAPRVPDMSACLLVAAGMGGLIMFVRMEQHTTYPVLDMHLFSASRAFAFSNVAALIHYAASYATMFLLSLYLQYMKGMQPQTAGLILLFQPVFQAVLSPFAGRLSDRIEPGILASVGMGMTGLGLGFFAYLRPDSSLVLIVCVLSFMGIGCALFSSPNMNAIMGSVHRRQYSVAAGISSTMRTLGMMASMGISTVLFAFMLKNAAIEPVTYPLFLKTVRLCFLLFACMCACGIYFSLARGKIHGHQGGGRDEEECLQEH
ncbi:MAG: MFS transporter [Desulfoplanes sp.]|nr:MFS transporter [Desulfoplanes sp.]